MTSLLDKLKGGDLRSVGRVDEVVADVLAEPVLFETLFSGMTHGDPVVRMRSADAVEKITTQRPEYLWPYKTVLIEEVARSQQQEVRWHVAQMMPRLGLTAEERGAVVGILMGYLEDRSRIVKTFSMQALADLAEIDPALWSQMVPVLEELTVTGTPAMRSRGKKLLKRLMEIEDGGLELG